MNVSRNNVLPAYGGVWRASFFALGTLAVTLNCGAPQGVVDDATTSTSDSASASTSYTYFSISKTFYLDSTDWNLFGDAAFVGNANGRVLHMTQNGSAAVKQLLPIKPEHTICTLKVYVTPNGANGVISLSDGSGHKVSQACSADGYCSVSTSVDNWASIGAELAAKAQPLFGTFHSVDYKGGPSPITKADDPWLVCGFQVVNVCFGSASKPSREVFELGNNPSCNDAGWQAQGTFRALSQDGGPGTTHYCIGNATNPSRSGIQKIPNGSSCTLNDYGWTKTGDFWAYDTQQPGMTQYCVTESTSGPDTYFITSGTGSCAQNGTRPPFTFWATEVLSIPLPR